MLLTTTGRTLSKGSSDSKMINMSSLLSSKQIHLVIGENRMIMMFVLMPPRADHATSRVKTMLAKTTKTKTKSKTKTTETTETAWIDHKLHR